MAPNVENSAFFQRKKANNELVVRDPPKFDLESYIANYDGFTRSHRLHHIAAHSPYLALDAYHMAIREAKQGKNVGHYMTLVEELGQIDSNDAAASIDTAWAEKKTKEVQAEHDKLEHELKSYKNNLIKESIRMGNEDLGYFFFACGDYTLAHKSYVRMREHCTSNRHLADMALRLVYTNIAQKSWLGMTSNLAKVDATHLKAEEKPKLEPIIAACSGLANMCSGNFRDAAMSFLYTSPHYLTAEPAAGIEWQKVVTGNDVAVYGGLCALASMDRNGLQEQVLANSDFRNFLELEPHIRRAISLFCSSKYSACLDILENHRSDYLLDAYLSTVLSTIYGMIRTKSIVQYFIPFSCVTLDEMASKFPPGGDYATIEEELEELINRKILDARIDLVDRLLVSPPTNPRHNVHEDALTMAENYDHTLRLRLTRINMLTAGMEVKQEKGHGGSAGGAMDSFVGNLRGMGSKFGF